MAGVMHGTAMQLFPRSFQLRSRPALQANRNQLQGLQSHMIVRGSREDALAELAKTKQGVSHALSEKEAALKQSGQASASGRSKGSEGTATESGLPALRELTKDDFQECLDEAGSKLVVVDFFTDWCGPCKVIYPTLQQMAIDQKDDVSIVKLNCNKYNKELGKQLGVKVAPTFQLYKKGEKVAEMTGAKVEELQELIDQNK